MNWPLPFRDPPLGRQPHRPWLLAGAIALVAFVVAGHGIRRVGDTLLPPPAVEEITLKLDWYDAHKAVIDTIFVGTSRLFFTVDPRVFDAATAELGCPTHAYNMGLAGLNFRELLAFLELIRDDPPPNLKLLFFEPRPSPGRDLEEMMSPRRRLTMTADTLEVSIDEAMANPRRGDRVWWYLAYYLAGWSYQNLGMGMISERLIHPAPPEDADRQPEWTEDRRGHRPLGLQKDGSVWPHDPKFLRPRTLEKWQDEVDSYKPDRRRPLHPGWRPILDAYLEILDGIHARAVVVLPPSGHWFSQSFARLVAEVRPDMPVVYFDPVTHPELYKGEAWYDDGHLNLEGGRTFSRELAAVACDIVGQPVAEVGGAASPGGPHPSDVPQLPRIH